MTSEQIRECFLKFFELKGHKVVPSSSLIPDDPSVLLTTAGMQQFKPYLTGELDPVKDFGSRTVTSIQKSFRTTDIDEVGDESHLTLFEMVGNFSFGGYFKEEAIPISFEFITSSEGLGIDPQKLYVTAFKGDDEVPRDDEAIAIWQEQFKKVGMDAKIGERIFLYGREKNWWEAGLGPAGPDAEMFYDRGFPHNPKFGPACHPNCDCGRFVEIGNDVFVQYNKIADGKYEPLAQKAIDNGRGFERLVVILQGKKTIFETDLFEPFMERLEGLLSRGIVDKKEKERVKRILADHLRASIFLIADGVRPSNKEAGYILRRLLRRILAYRMKYDIHADLFPEAVLMVQKQFGKVYPELNNTKQILLVLEEEKEKFQEAIGRGIAEIEKFASAKQEIDGKNAFYLYESFGLPLEVTLELAPKALTKNLRKADFEKEFEKHQEISRAGMEKKFGGHGLLLDTGEIKAGSEEEFGKALRLHTATHLLHWALREVLGKEVHQMGSDITPERSRFDFSFSKKLTQDEIKKIGELINEKIKEDLPVHFKEMPKTEAEQTGALHFFKQKYPDQVKVYFIGGDPSTGLDSELDPRSSGRAISAEFCGGPHVTHTGEIGEVKILKEEAVSAGVRRIRIAL